MRDLGGREPAVVVEDEHRTLFGLESTEPPLQLFPIRDRTGLVADGGFEHQRSDPLRPAPHLPSLVRTGVDHEAVEPGVELVRVAQGGELLPGADQRFLDRVLGEVRLSKDQASDGVEAVAGGHGEDLEGLVVASGCRFDEVASHTLSTIGTVSVTCAVRYDGRGDLIYSIATVAGRRRVADQPAPVDACYTRPMVDVPGPTGPGIDWEPGDEDYPFATVPGESALDYLRRWLDSATYARVERGGVRYVHEEDVANLFNHVTADVDLLRARLETFGDHVLVASDHRLAIARAESAIADLRAVLDTLQPPDR